MDSWMPWTITRNFIRAFCPTLSLLIAWDIWRDLGHASAMQRQTLLIDAIALCAILAIRLQPPLALAWEQLKYPFAWKQLKYPFRLTLMCILGVGPFLMVLLDPIFFPMKGLLTVVGYIFILRSLPDLQNLAGGRGKTPLSGLCNLGRKRMDRLDHCFITQGDGHVSVERCFILSYIPSRPDRYICV